MNKYFKLAQITLQEYFVYRLNFILWRFRSLVSFLTLIFFWLAVYGNRTDLLGYSKAQMIAYMIGLAFLKSIILGSRIGDLAGQIRSGEMTKIVIKPFNMFYFWLTKDLVDKTLNLFFVIFEILLVVKLLGLEFYIPKNFSSLVCFLIISVISLFLNFYINMLLSMAAFWTDDVWATRFLFGVIFLEFFSGAFFPLDILPNWLVRIFNLTPFPYLIFFPLKIWLEQVDSSQILNILLISIAWLIGFYILAKLVWRKGAKNYGAYGG